MCKAQLLETYCLICLPGGGESEEGRDTGRYLAALLQISDCRKSCWDQRREGDACCEAPETWPCPHAHVVICIYARLLQVHHSPLSLWRRPVQLAALALPREAARGDHAPL
jgi:hypothetical protein